MNIFALSGLLTGITGSVMALLMFWKGKQSIHFIWGFFCVSVIVWGFGGYKIGTTTDPGQALLWWKITYVGVIMIPIFFTHFVHKLLEIKQKWIIWVLYGCGFFFLFMNFATNLFTTHVRWAFNQFYYLDNPTFVYNSFVAFFIILVIYTHLRLWETYKTTQGMMKGQIKYLFIATALGFGGGSFSYLPVYNIDIYPVLNLMVFPFSPIVAYSIFKYRLMDVRVVARKVFIYISLGAFSYGFFYLIAWLFETFFGGIFTKTSLVVGSLIAPAFIAIFYWLVELLQNIANKYFFASLYNYQATMSNLSEQLNYLTNVGKIVDSIIDTLKSAMQLEKSAVILFNVENEKGKPNYKIARTDDFSEEGLITLAKNELLMSQFQKAPKPLLDDELNLLIRDSIFKEQRIGFENLKQEMEKLEASLYQPLTSGNKLIGLLILGKKISRDPYTKEDLELLHGLSLQAGIAIENALLYKQVQDFSQHLQDKVDVQTKELKDANERLKELDKLKDDFVSIASHELRTPMTVIKSYIWMVLNKKQLAKDVRLYLEKSKLATERLINLVNNMLDVSRIESGRITLKLGSVSLLDLTKEIVEEMTTRAKELKLTLKINESPTPAVLCDQEKIREIFQNLIGNSMKFTPPGGSVTVSFTIKDNFVFTTVTDTGQGISPEDAQKLFTKFGRLQNSYSKVAETRGTGLGLYISKSIINLHKGIIEAKSEGVGKGSQFTFSLPMVESEVAEQLERDTPKEDVKPIVQQTNVQQK